MIVCTDAYNNVRMTSWLIINGLVLLYMITLVSCNKRHYGTLQRKLCALGRTVRKVREVHHTSLHDQEFNELTVTTRSVVLWFIITTRSSSSYLVAAAHEVVLVVAR